MSLQKYDGKGAVAKFFLNFKMSLQKYDGKGAVAKFFRPKFYTAFTQCSKM